MIRGITYYTGDPRWICLWMLLSRKSVIFNFFFFALVFKPTRKNTQTDRQEDSHTSMHTHTHTYKFMLGELEGTTVSLNLSFTFVRGACGNGGISTKTAVFLAPHSEVRISFLKVFYWAPTLSSESSSERLLQCCCLTTIIVSVPAALPQMLCHTFNLFLEFFSTNIRPGMLTPCYQFIWTISRNANGSPFIFARRNPEMTVPPRQTKVCLDSLLSWK